MLDILLMVVFFLESVFVHLTLCRKSAGQGLLLKPFFTIALGNLLVLLSVSWGLHHYGHLDPDSVWGVPLYLSTALCYLLMVPTYLVFYFSTEQMSPSKKILLLLTRRGPMSMLELLAHFSDEEFVMPRLRELIGIHCVVEHSGWYVLTPSGNQMAQVYRLYQSVLGRTKGG